MSTNAPSPESCHRHPLSGPNVSSVEFGKSLQLTRASTMALTRLQLALTREDRHQARVAMDCLLDIDAELEGFVAELSIPQELDDPDWDTISEHLKALKSAIAFEKLVLAGEMAGPALTRAATPPQVPPPPLDTVNWPVEGPEGDAPAGYSSVRLERWMPAGLAVLAALLIGGVFFIAYTLL